MLRKKSFIAESLRTPGSAGISACIGLRKKRQPGMPGLPGLLGVLCVSAVIGLCSCALSAEHGTQPQQENASPARQSDAKPAVSKKSAAAVDPNKFALVVAGVGGEEAYTRKFTAQATRLYEALTMQLGFAAKNVTLLTEAASGGGPEDGARESEAPARRATADEVRKAFASIKSAGNADSLVLVVLIGHGSFDN